MKLTLLLPGLLWLDGHDGADVCKGLEMPALQRLLGQGARLERPAALSEMLAVPWRGSTEGLARLLARQAGLPAEQGIGCWPIRCICAWTATAPCWPISA